MLFAELGRRFEATLRVEEKLKALHSDLVGKVQMRIVTSVCNTRWMKSCD